MMGPAVGAQQGGDAPIAVTAIRAGQPDDGLAQRRFIIADQVPLALGGTGLTDGAASPSFRDVQPLLQMHHALTPAFRA